MSKALIITPDYASHYYPISAVASELKARGHRVVVATGPGLLHRARSDGFETLPLVLGPGNNPGLIRVQDQSGTEGNQLASFFEASRRGPIATLTHQARHRLDDLLWEPLRVASRIDEIVQVVDPDIVLVDHLAYGATAALRGLGVGFATFHPGHPAAISSDRPYGVPMRFPPALDVDVGLLEELESLCSSVAQEFTARYNGVIESLGSGEPVEDAFTAPSSLTLINYPAALGTGYDLPLVARLIGSAVRDEELPEELSAAVASRAVPSVYVSLGSFFSARSDLLNKLVSAFRSEPVQVILATGVTSPSELGNIPGDWIVAPHFPQPPLLGLCDLVVTHGGNNTVTEALTAGTPLLVGPLSTDQFDGAADIAEAGLGAVFDPNRASYSDIADRAHEVLSSDAPGRARALGEALRSSPGQVQAVDELESLAPSASRDARDGVG